MAKQTVADNDYGLHEYLEAMITAPIELESKDEFRVELRTQLGT